MERLWQFLGSKPQTYSYLMDNSEGKNPMISWESMQEYEMNMKSIGRACKEELLLIFTDHFKMY